MKRCYCTFYINGEKTNYYFTDNDVVDMDALRVGLDNVPLRDFSMREEYYGMMRMSTYGTNNQMGEEIFIKIVEERIICKYVDIVHNQYEHRGVFDSNNTRLQSPIC